ncbi:MAG: tyrosine-protein phosphatase [Lachnospiraceae bacterium]|nr:tyrosine-protein phosphatase [Lachnospiraceae bacterium]
MNIRNFRDISGYQNRDGKVMKKNKIFRGGALDSMTKEDADYFEDVLAIRHILDFRDAKEAQMAKDYQLPVATYEQISALQVKEHDENGFDFEKIMKKGLDASQFRFILAYLKEGYRTMPFDNPAYRRLFALLMQNDGHIYFHCTAGKDRTGVAGFLIMMALGMEEEDAVKEYLLSNQYLKQAGLDLAGQLHIPPEYQRMCEPLLGVQEDFIRLAIDAIKDLYGDYDTFFQNEYKLGREERKLLMEIYCE